MTRDTRDTPYSTANYKAKKAKRFNPVTGVPGWLG